MELVRVNREGALAEVVLDRPKVNAMNQALLRDMTAAFQQVAADDTVAGVLVRGEGKALSAGLDLNEVMMLDDKSILDFLDQLDAAFLGAFTLRVPVAVAVTGHAVAGGLVLALAGDYVALQRGDYKLGLTELKVGVPLPRVAFEIVDAALPKRCLRTLVLEADTYDPETAHDLGVGDSLVDDAVSDARRWLEMTAARPQAAFAFVKEQRRRETWARCAQAKSEQPGLIAAMLAARGQLGG